MHTRNSHPYLLGESSKSHTTPIDSQQIAVMFAKINAKLDILKTFKERLAKVETTRKPLESPTGDQILLRNNRRTNTDNLPNPDVPYLKSIKIDVPNFDRHHDP